MATRLPAGKMRHVVAIKEHKIDAASTDYDSYGQVSASSTAWSTVLKARAAIEQLSGREAEVARQVYASATHRVTVDYHATLASTGGSRRAVVFGDRFLHVGAVLNEDQENVQLQLLCGEDA